MDIDRDQLVEFLRANLTLELNVSPQYTGGMGGRDLYEDSKTLQLRLCGEPISEVYL